MWGSRSFKSNGRCAERTAQRFVVRNGNRPECRRSQKKNSARARRGDSQSPKQVYAKPGLCGRDWKTGKHWGEFWEAYVLRMSISDWQAVINISISALAL